MSIASIGAAGLFKKSKGNNKNLPGKALDILLLMQNWKKKPLCKSRHLKATLLEGNTDLLAFESLHKFKHLFTDVILQLISSEAKQTDSASLGGESTSGPTI